ncbi:GGDEF domain-containing protein [Pantoea sp. 18069]|uniref:GGDEF domain-containing protein n=1 Tax=Pantoea sp. 18069 TaxID=2681415 RepID=UPI00135B0280|nr:GGDEF domain-containing protein [Pantoea sp. 18069]
MPHRKLMGFEAAADREQAYREQTLKRLQGTAVEMGVTAVLGSVAALLARLLIPTPQYLELRVLLLPLTALFAYLIVRAPSVRAYGWCCMATIGTVSLNSYLGALGTDRPLLYFVPAAVLIVLTTSFFWITWAQWIGGALVSYACFLPFVIAHDASRTDTVFSLLFAGMALVTGFVSHLRIQDSQHRAFAQECRLAELTVTDTLTGASSRAEFLQQAEKAAVKARATGAPLTLLYLDIDHFKRLNDGHGHAAGDAVLRGMSGVLQRALRASDVFGRLGGEEFCVLLPEQAQDKAQALADRLRLLLAQVPRPDGRLTVSAGIATLRAGESVMQTLHRADLAMLKAKQSGRDTVCVADEAIHDARATDCP